MRRYNTRVVLRRPGRYWWMQCQKCTGRIGVDCNAVNYQTLLECLLANGVLLQGVREGM